MSGDSQLLPGGDDYLGEWSILGDPRQRRILSILRERSHPMTARDLAVELTAQETGITPSDVTEGDHHPVHVDLYHRCLPKLESVGWIERHPEGIIASEPNSPVHEELSGPLSPDSALPTWEAIDALLTRPRRQDIVSILAGTHHRFTLEELAAELESVDARWRLAEREEGLGIPGTLHHVDLPKLAAVGLVEYDPDEKTITRTPSLMRFVDRMDLCDR